MRQQPPALRVVPTDSPVQDKTAASPALASQACPGPGSLDADAAALLADIDAFDLEATRLRVQEIDARHTGLRVSSTLFPAVVPDADFPKIRVDSAMPPAPVAEPAVAPAPRPCGLLGQLKDEVVNRQRVASDETRQSDALRSNLDLRLRSVFEYFHELTTQLNYLRPAIARSYFFLDSDDAFRNLNWLEGHADFRSQAESCGGGIERVMLGYTLKGNGERTLERVGGGVERLRQVLFDLGLKFECRERRNRQRELEQGVFTVADEISVQVVWRADFENQTVVVESRNLERLGYTTCTLPPDAIGPALLDEFGRLMLGQDNRFRSYLIR